VLGQLARPGSGDDRPGSRREVVPGPGLGREARTRGEPFDLVAASWLSNFHDPSAFLNLLLDGRSITAMGNHNWSYFNVARYNRLLARPARLSGTSRYLAYGRLETRLARDAMIDLAAVCLKQ
jgi:ABC-type oligopeptide transport system substrate-binding subunit